MQGSGTQWRGLFQDAYGEITQIQERAAELAGSWQSLFKSRRINQLEAAPWDRPSPFEVKASSTWRNTALFNLILSLSPRSVAYVCCTLFFSHCSREHDLSELSIHFITSQGKR